MDKRKRAIKRDINMCVCLFNVICVRERESVCVYVYVTMFDILEQKDLFKFKFANEISYR